MTNETEDSALPIDHGQDDEGMAEAVIAAGHLIRVRIPVSVLEAEALFQCLMETVG